MRKPGTDENNVQMSDVLCDFCRREWTEDLPMVEGHKGNCICGRCLSVAYQDVMSPGATASSDFFCTMCLEGAKDRHALGRGSEPGWRSPAYPDAAICRRCVKQAAGVLVKDGESGWRRPDIIATR